MVFWWFEKGGWGGGGGWRGGQKLINSLNIRREIYKQSTLFLDFA